jgi:hypothetical protein
MDPKRNKEEESPLDDMVGEKVSIRPKKGKKWTGEIKGVVDEETFLVGGKKGNEEVSIFHVRSLEEE